MSCQQPLPLGSCGEQGPELFLKAEKKIRQKNGNKASPEFTLKSFLRTLSGVGVLWVETETEGCSHSPEPSSHWTFLSLQQAETHLCESFFCPCYPTEQIKGVWEGLERISLVYGCLARAAVPPPPSKGPDEVTWS